MLWIFFALAEMPLVVEMVAAYSHPRRTSYTFWAMYMLVQGPFTLTCPTCMCQVRSYVQPGLQATGLVYVYVNRSYRQMVAAGAAAECQCACWCSFYQFIVCQPQFIVVRPAAHAYTCTSARHTTGEVAPSRLQRSITVAPAERLTTG